ncbi:MULTISPECIES: DUF4183 domain-containing protein [Bacillaceae]|uniref:DUF4183 domain-containing protein n=1 Tax=Oceanobacillus caeni TaxID=405946 RepID=A0ABR5MFJ0_9BACI|nr:MULTISPECIES: DUF4183 domain-containing protein [Bacillaceae]KPH71107.1 hypothetical protein AFL42_16375 [Oceanobacillus caeni]MED4475021.1 DUF4183 domain-containing protein [Oceanobacillus caeni]
MALQLMKLAVSADTTTDITPTDTRFFHVTSGEISAGDDLVIDAAEFFADDGSAVIELPELIPGNSYYNVYVNGVLQMDGISVYTPGTTGTGNLTITVPAVGGPIIAGSPIVLEILNYSASSDTTVTT